MTAQTTARHYHARNGLILAAPYDRVMSPARATELRDTFLEDVARVEKAYGIASPLKARLLADGYLAQARELSDALAAVGAFDPEPSASLALTPMFQVAA